MIFYQLGITYLVIVANFPTLHYEEALIRSFACKDTQRLFHDYRVRRFQAFETRARRKLKMLHDSTRLDDLATLPGNRLEMLRGDRRGQHGIRINNQYRICFVWKDGDALNVEIVDYH